MTEPRWTVSVGEDPRVVVWENAQRKDVLYMRWWDRGEGNWEVRSLRQRLRTANGRIIKATEVWARAQAQAQYERLTKALPPEARPVAPLTIRDGLKRATDPATGKYPTATPHRREVTRSLEHAERILGNVPWNAIRRGDIRKLWRTRYTELTTDGQVGVRGAEIVVRDLLAVAQWLRDEEAIDPGACIAEKNWKEALRTEAGNPEPHRPRHTLDEMRRILMAAFEVDPRFGLLLALGAELRLGQVIRARRSDLDLSANTFTVRRRGKKGGAIILLTPGQRTAVDRALAGYLADLEGLAMDYPLFPAGKLAGWEAIGGTVEAGHRSGHRLVVGRDGLRATTEHADRAPVDRSALDDWFREAENLAEVPHVEGRGAYGLRRIAVDAVLDAGIDSEALKEHGGWSDDQVPRDVYRTKQREQAQRKAAEFRADLRGEV